MAHKTPGDPSPGKNSSPRQETDPPEGDDSIEIIEVVGMNENRKPAAGSAPASPVESPAKAPEDEIPFSREQLYDMLLRRQAEFDNARKRLEREREETRRRAWMEVMGRILPVIDNFERALGESSSTAASTFREGITLTVQQLKDALAREGLEEIRAVGEHFDPHRHEAVETAVVAGLEPGMVLEDLRRGYLFRGQLLRPSLVKVSTAAGANREEES